MGSKKLKLFLTIAAVLAMSLTVFLACSDDDETLVEVPVYMLYYDVYGNAEFESDGNYPPPDNLDNDYDGEITVILYFNEDFDIFQKDDIYGYYVTGDSGPGTDPNFWFPFVPDFSLYLSAEFTSADSCFFYTSEPFQHTDSVSTRVDLFPTYVGDNMNCYNVTLTAAEDEMVEVNAKGKTLWVTKEVYEKFYKENLEEM